MTSYITKKEISLGKPVKNSKQLLSKKFIERSVHVNSGTLFCHAVSFIRYWFTVCSEPIKINGDHNFLISTGLQE